MIRIPISDLVYINEGAKALKCRNFMWKGNKLINIDSPDYVAYGKFNNLDKITTFPHRGLIINQRDLAKIIKSITTESYFDITDDISSYSTLIHTVSDTATISVDASMDNLIDKNLSLSHEMDELIGSYKDIDVTSRLTELFSLNKTSGSIYFQYDIEHMMILFGGILPLTKSDKILLDLYDYPDGKTFCTRFIVVKKLFKIYVYLKYIKI